MTDRVPSPLHARSQLLTEKGVGAGVEVPTHLVATSCFLSCNQRKSDMKSKCCVYVRMASCFRGSHNFDSPAPARVLNIIATGRTDSTKTAHLDCTVVVAGREEVRRRTHDTIDGCAAGYTGFIDAPAGP